MSTTSTILLVEDQERLRKLYRTFLEGLGHSVLVAEDGLQALELLERHPGVSLLITDIMLPHMSGDSLAEQVKSRAPEVAILLISAYADRDAESFRYPVLAKPFSLDALSDQVKRLVGAAAT